jgi:hypothetical protein
MPTPEDLQEKAAELADAGIAERQISDRRVRNYNPKDIIDAAEKLAASQSITGPFQRVGLKSRPF